MRMIWQAVRAVTVEVAGVGAVIFMLFGAAGWTAESAGVRTGDEVDRALNWIHESADHVIATIKPNLTADQRKHFAANRLEHYGHLYGDAAGGFAKQAASQISSQEAQIEGDSNLPTNQLLGTL